MANRNVEAFSLSHAAILDGTTGVEEAVGDLYGIRSGSLELDQDSYDNTGDDAVLSTWNWGNKATVTIQSGYFPFEAYALISGATVTSSGSGASEILSAPLWATSHMNTATRPMLLRMPSKDALGVVRVLDIVLYKVQFQPFSFDGPSYKEGLLVNYNGTALFSNVDETGAALPEPTVGRIISRGV